MTFHVIKTGKNHSFLFSLISRKKLMRVQLYIDTAGPGMQYKNMRRAIYILNFFIMFTLSVSDPMCIGGQQ